MYSIGLVNAAGELVVLDRWPNRIGLMVRAHELSRERRSPVVLIRAGELEGTVWAPGLKREPRLRLKEEMKYGNGNR